MERVSVELLAAILYVVVGVLMILRPAAGALSLTLLIGAFFLAGGIFRIVAAAVLCDLPTGAGSS
ncbi:MAG: DUF308 domain-containing protein [Nitrospira sp.]